jgi:3-dehydroquinate synthase
LCIRDWVCAARLSERVCGLRADETARLADLVVAAKLPATPPTIARERWLELMQRDKKVQSGAMRFVLLERLGRAVVLGEITESDVFQSVAPSTLS